MPLVVSKYLMKKLASDRQEPVHPRLVPTRGHTVEVGHRPMASTQPTRRWRGPARRPSAARSLTGSPGERRRNDGNGHRNDGAALAMATAANGVSPRRPYPAVHPVRRIAGQSYPLGAPAREAEAWQPDPDSTRRVDPAENRVVVYAVRPARSDLFPCAT
jgi:hypothetical protein